jgi:hypothetical protein
MAYSVEQIHIDVTAVSEHVDTKFFHQYGQRMLAWMYYRMCLEPCTVDSISRTLRLRVFLATMFTGHEFLQLFPLGYLNDRVYRTNPHTVQELQAETEAVYEEITGDMLRDTVDSFVVCLWRVHQVEESRSELTFT